MAREKSEDISQKAHKVIREGSNPSQYELMNFLINNDFSIPPPPPICSNDDSYEANLFVLIYLPVNYNKIISLYSEQERKRS